MSSTKKNTVTIRTGLAKYMADAMLAAADKEGWTPIIEGAHIRVADSALTAIATDRYRVHLLPIEIEGKAKDHDFVMPRNLLTWLSKNAATFNRSHGALNPVVTITTVPPGEEKDDNGLCEITVRKDADVDTDVLTMRGQLVRGNFPPVERLVEAARNAEVVATPPLLDLDFMASMRALSPERKFPARVRFVKATGDNKPPVAHVVFARGGKTYAEAILQSHLEGR